MVPSPEQFKKTKVTEWIKNLRIAFPYSLNDKIGEEYQVHTTDIIGLKFIHFWDHIYKLEVHQNINHFSSREFLFNLNRYQIESTLNAINLIRTQII